MGGHLEEWITTAIEIDKAFLAIVFEADKILIFSTRFENSSPGNIRNRLTGAVIELYQ